MSNSLIFSARQEKKNFTSHKEVKTCQGMPNVNKTSDTTQKSKQRLKFSVLKNKMVYQF